MGFDETETMLSIETRLVLPITECEETKTNIDPDDNWPNIAKKISFSSQCSVIEIPNRDSYSLEEARDLWVPAPELKQLTERNLIEFAAEGWSPQAVIEEQDMVMDVDGTLLHPIHLNPMLKSALLRNCPYPRAVSPDEIMPGIPFYPSASFVDRPSSPFVETIVNQNYSHLSEDDDQLLQNDPDGYLLRRFANHERYEDALMGDAEDAIINQILR
jgi:hypothetical protein